jgi:hypothetical protein
MPGGRLELVRPDDEITAEDANEVRRAVNGLLGMSVDAATMTLSWHGGIPYLGAAASSPFQWFYTTGPLAAATVTATGTALGSASDAMSHCNARRCNVDIAGVITPDTAASDEVIYCGDVLSASVLTGTFVLCALAAGFWTVIDASRCPGS